MTSRSTETTPAKAGAQKQQVGLVPDPAICRSATSMPNPWRQRPRPGQRQESEIVTSASSLLLLPSHKCVHPLVRISAGVRTQHPGLYILVDAFPSTPKP